MIGNMTRDSCTINSFPSDSGDTGSNDSGKVLIPESEGGGFSFGKMWAFTGPGLLLCIAYMDPGNIEADLQAGVQAKYKLLWVLLGSTALGLVMQRLALRLGVVTGQHLAEMCYLQYPRLPRLFLWLMMEVAIIGSDMQEVIGTAIALYLLSNKLIPLWVGVVLTIIDTFMFLLLDRYGLRKLEIFFAALVAVMISTFGYEFVVGTPDTGQLFEGLVYPWCQDCDKSVMLQAIGIIGSTIMPHNLYLHSGLVKSRAIDRTKASRVKEANLFFFWECFVGLFLSLVINAIITAVFAHGLFHKTNSEVLNICIGSSVPYENIFSNNSEVVQLDIYSGGIYLGCHYGALAMYVWGVGVLAAGEGTTMTGCYAGQLAMEGFLQLKWSKWKRVLFTRSFAILPTFIVAFYSSIAEMSNMNDFLNAVMSIQIPFATLPLVAFTSNPRLMGQFVNGITNKILTMLVSAMVIAINVYFVTSSWLAVALQDYRLLTFLALYFIIYFAMCIYLVLHTFANMAISDSVLTRIFVHKTNWRNENLDFWSCSVKNLS